MLFLFFQAEENGLIKISVSVDSAEGDKQSLCQSIIETAVYRRVSVWLLKKRFDLSPGFFYLIPSLFKGRVHENGDGVERVERRSCQNVFRANYVPVIRKGAAKKIDSRGQGPGFEGTCNILWVDWFGSTSFWDLLRNQQATVCSKGFLRLQIPTVLSL